MKIVVIGGTGLIGSKVVAKLCRPRVTKPSPRRRTPASTPSPARDSPRRSSGAAVVVDVSNSPSFEDAAVLEFFETSTRNILDAETAAGVGHHVALSVVGSERLPDSGYLRAKVAQEKLIKDSSHPVLDRARDAVLRVRRAHRRRGDGRRHRAPAVACSSNRWRPTTSPRWCAEVARRRTADGHDRDRRPRAVPVRRARAHAPRDRTVTRAWSSPIPTLATSAPSSTSARSCPATARVSCPRPTTSGFVDDRGRRDQPRTFVPRFLDGSPHDPRAERRVHPRATDRSATTRGTDDRLSLRRDRARRPRTRSGPAGAGGRGLGGDRMTRILLQTTIVDTPDDWNVGRFSLLAEELRRAGHDVTARNRDGGEVDPTLSRSTRSTTTSSGCSPSTPAADSRPTTRPGSCGSGQRGGGVVTARDHHDLGSCLRSLGSIGRVNHFHTENPEPNARRDDQDNPGISWPNYHSGANGDYQRGLRRRTGARAAAHRRRRRADTSSGSPRIRTRARCRCPTTAPSRTVVGTRAQHRHRAALQPRGRARRRDDADDGRPWVARSRARRSTTSPT